MARAIVTDLGEFYRAQGAKQERERISKWLDAIDQDLRVVAFETPNASEDEKADAAAGHALIEQLQQRLSES